MRVIALLLLAIVGIAVGLAPLNRVAPKDRVPDKYIVVYNDNVSVEELEAELSHLTAVSGILAERTFRVTIKGFSGKFTPQQVAVIRASDKVAYIEEDQVVSIAVEQQTCQVQTGAGWGLTRVSQRALNPDGVYRYPSSQGAGVNAYIIDTGIYLAHSDFTSRATFGFKAENGWSNTDGNGHGTHVASTVGGVRYGVAKQASLIAVKVLSDAGSGTTAGVIAGVEWATTDYQSKTRPAVGNMSLGGGVSQALNSACNAASNAGLHMIVAAGNENNNACTRSPASATTVVSTGSTDIGIGTGGTQIDVRSYFSNYGPCVAIFAPGSDILGAWIGGTTASRVISGTSMASPHVCGIAALLVGQNPSWTFDQVYSALQDQATPDIIDLECTSTICNQSPNFLAFNGCTSK